MSEKRVQLLAAACRVIALHGVRGLRVEDVAADARSSTALIYYHFRDRAGLISNTLAYVNDRAEGYTRAAAGRDGRERLARQLSGEFQEDPEVRENSAVWGEIRGAAVFDNALRPLVEAATTGWQHDLAALIREGQADGSISADIDPDPLAIRLTALIEGLSNRWLAGMLGVAEAHGHVQAALAAELDRGSGSAVRSPGRKKVATG